MVLIHQGQGAQRKYLSRVESKGTHSMTIRNQMPKNLIGCLIVNRRFIEMHILNNLYRIIGEQNIKNNMLFKKMHWFSGELSSFYFRCWTFFFVEMKNFFEKELYLNKCELVWKDQNEKHAGFFWHLLVLFNNWQNIHV